jgi:hypothetical protein
MEIEAEVGFGMSSSSAVRAFWMRATLTSERGVSRSHALILCGELHRTVEQVTNRLMQDNAVI